jgi:hypothetical protein
LYFFLLEIFFLCRKGSRMHTNMKALGAGAATASVVDPNPKESEYFGCLKRPS